MSREKIGRKPAASNEREAAKSVAASMHTPSENP